MTHLKFKSLSQANPHSGFAPPLTRLQSLQPLRLFLRLFGGGHTFRLHDLPS